MEIYGYEFDQTNALAEEVHRRLETIQGVNDDQVSRKSDKPLNFRLPFDEINKQVGVRAFVWSVEKTV